MATFLFPYPPSVNTYWGFQGHRRFLTPKAVHFKAVVAAVVSVEPERFGSATIEVTVELYPPDKRRRDADSPIKSLFDALTQSGLFNDDSQIAKFTVTRKAPRKGGFCLVTVAFLHDGK